jgi:RNA polymerase sigma factor for flagellar operon FliA
MENLDDSHVELVKQVAASVAARLPAHVSHADLIGWGNLGLVDAAHRFDPTKASFTTFARYRIRGAILDGLRSEDPVSRADRKRFRRAQQTIDQLAGIIGRQPDEEEMADANGLTLPKWQELRARFGRMGLTSPFSKPEVNADALPGKFSDGYEAALSSERRSVLDRAVQTLPPRHRIVILLYYGRDLTMREVAVRLGVNESRVSQIHHAAIGRLRRAIE